MMAVLGRIKKSIELGKELGRRGIRKVCGVGTRRQQEKREGEKRERAWKGTDWRSEDEAAAGGWPRVLDVA